MEPRKKWNCFHCGFATDSDSEAEAHFGESGFPALCLDWNSWTPEDRIKEFQSMLCELDGEREETILLTTKLTALQAAGDALEERLQYFVDIYELAKSTDWPKSNVAIQERIDEMRPLLANWQAAKEIK